MSIFRPGFFTRAGYANGVAIVVALVLFLMLANVQAHAHATLTGTMPADGAVVALPPQTVVLTFNEPVSLIASMLIVPDGRTLVLEEFTSSASSVSVMLPNNLGQGSHAFGWRAVSEDGHPISGTTFFIVGTGSSIPLAEAASQAEPLVPSLLWVARLVLFIGIFFGVGGAAFRILAEMPPKAASLAQWASISGLAAVPAVMGLQGLDLTGAGLIQFFNGRSWWLGLTSPYGTTLMLAFLSLILSLVTLQLPSRHVGKAVATIALLISGLAVSASGHASAADPQWLTRPALFVHVTTIAWWVGALVPLVLLLRHDQHVATPALIRFSRAIPFAIVPLIMSGAILAIVQLGPPGPSWWSAYGQILAAKLGLLVLLFSIASWNRWVLTAPAANGNARALRHMRRSIVLEIVIILGVLCLVSIWRFTPPPRALTAPTEAPLAINLASDDLALDVVFSSDRPGVMNVTIELGDLSARSVKLTLGPRNDAIAEITRMADPVSNGRWVIEALTVPLSGVWPLEIEVRVTDFQLTKIDGMVEFEQ